MGSRNAVQIKPDEWAQTVDYPLEQWSLVQIMTQVGLAMRLFTAMSMLIKSLVAAFISSYAAKRSVKDYASGWDRRGWIVGRRSVSERPTHNETRLKLVTGKVMS